MSERALFFNGHADAYFHGHAGYPEELVNEVLEFSRFPEGGRILEIGAGSAQATFPFARRGLDITAIEPGQKMIDFARQKVGEAAKVEFVLDTFDQWPLQKERYDLVISARALHWVDPKLRFTKTADALKPGGCLATFRNVHIYGDEPIYQELQTLIGKYRKFQFPARAGEMEEQFLRSKNYHPVVEKVFKWERISDAETFVQAQAMRLEYRKLSQEQRKELFGAMHKLVLDHGGIIRQKYETILLISRKRKGSSWLQRLFYPKKTSPLPP